MLHAFWRDGQCEYCNVRIDLDRYVMIPIMARRPRPAASRIASSVEFLS